MRNFFIFILILTLSVSSNSNDLFNTKYYELNFTSNNVDNDKINKINEIKLNSLNNILKSILNNTDYLNIKEELDQNFINLFVQNIIIEEEKIINNNYYSKVMINYDKFKIINYLRANKLSYVEKLPKEFLIIIYENNGIEKNLFSKNNKYYNYLINNSNHFYKIPNLDVNDKYLLNYQDIEKKNIRNIKKIIKKYSDIDTIILTSQKNSNMYNYDIFLYTNDKLLKIYELDIRGNSFNDLFEIIKAKVLNQWKIENSIQNNELKKITCTIKYFSPKELKKIKNLITNVSLIEKIVLKNISFQINKYDIYHYGNIAILVELFMDNRIGIKFDNDQCKISLR